MVGGILRALVGLRDYVRAAKAFPARHNLA
jgi:hypothetical protein